MVFRPSDVRNAACGDGQVVAVAIDRVQVIPGVGLQAAGRGELVTSLATLDIAGWTALGSEQQASVTADTCICDPERTLGSVFGDFRL